MTTAGAGAAGTGLRRLLGRASLNLLDQIVSATTNVVLSIVVARASDASGFGAFAVAFLVFSVLIGAQRGIVGQPLSIRFSGMHGTQRRQVIGASTGAGLILALAAVVPVFVAGLLSGGSLGATLLALAVTLPGLLMQDTCRMVFFAQSRPHLALVNDLVWAALQFALIAVLLAGGATEPWQFVLAWGGAATASALLALTQLAVLPRLGRAIGWLREQRDLGGYLLMEFLVGAGATQGGILLVGAIGSIDDVGSLRAGQVLLGPLGILATALLTFALPEVSRRTALGTGARYRIAATVSAFLLVVSVAYAALILLIPDALGVQLLGATWAGASAVLLPLAVYSLVGATGMGPAVILYAMGHARRTFQLHTVEAPLMLAALVVGVSVGGAVGAAWGMAVTAVLMFPLWCWQLIAAVSGRSSRPADDDRR